MSLYQKYRPATFDEVKGNTEVINTLKKMLSDKASCPHAFLFEGPTGCGKTTLGRVVASELECKDSDLKEVDSADFRGIDTIRDIRQKSSFLPIVSKCRVWIIDECHKMTNDAQNALLKILEDTPKHVYFILCTTEPNKLISTIKGRCSTFTVKPLDETQLYGLLRKVAREEGDEITKEIATLIFKSSKGHARNALQILEQVLKVDAESRVLVAQKAEQETVMSIDLCRALMKRAHWKEIAALLANMKAQEQDPETIRRVVLGYCQAILLKGQDEALCGLIMEEFMGPFYDSGFPQLVYACYAVTKN